MLSPAKSALICQTGPGTPGGDFFRSYWLPIALSTDAEPGGQPHSVRILSEDLVLFRTQEGVPGLVAKACSHRLTDLSLGRVEDGGIRCIYHGWLFGTDGQCLDQPGERPENKFCEKIKQPSYPVHEAGGAVFAYMGTGEPPEFPRLEPFLCDEGQVFNTKSLWNSNWLQGFEGDIDLLHTSYLHAFNGNPPGVNPPPVPGSDLSMAELLAESIAPDIDLRESHYGYTACSSRPLPDNERYVRYNLFALPSQVAVAGFESSMGDPGFTTQYRVPIDDDHHYRIEFIMFRKQQIDKQAMWDGLRAFMWEEDGDHYKQKAENNYLQDREDMMSDAPNTSFAGLGTFIPAHDAAVVETMGTPDRTKEHLAASDKPLATARRLILEGIQAVQDGETPRNVKRTPEENRFPDWQLEHRVISADVDIWEYFDENVAKEYEPS